ncbi:methyltransferase domain-containing protein [Pectobacterium parmentieri]|uniref:Methyltransferase domain-containing protein n=1 Tax=Pectobacterium parmentieri TaxID=1905730 RepID=A0A8B3FCJ1_PECPM|nr:methyltransferase domain-containing protein [Pectobacterium parmentieri]AOR58841.1 hypothetical protein A8F97_07965 [Pectobacterium parmentieri]AYH10123.1 methyltransferase domain-containing protein [Pectobacterium parmentieri]AYH19166.1 methyltransferase domain-containing protein [Pectobacterium parmentieri]AYH36442.1 methyltransferase domain-containing protein [Pectobacterium parmentieri]AZS56548.1 methyltransferase domain-containing protein [Pectobacterium parmentieri]
MTGFNGDVKKFVNDAMDEYCNQWKVNSEGIKKCDGYKWMSSFLNEAKFVLEIGCGAGLSTKQLLADGHKVISIDENPKCLETAKGNLEDAGFKVLLVLRGKITKERYKKSNGAIEYTIKYFNDFFEVINEDEYDAILIESDVWDYSLLSEWLKPKEIDAVICWLIGSHGARSFNKILINNGNPKSGHHYRILTQNKVYELADAILGKDGMLHIVDRGALVNEDEEKKIRQCHEEQASVTSMKITTIDSVLYRESNEDGAMKMINEDIYTNKVNQVEGDTYLISVLSKKG